MGSGMNSTAGSRLLAVNRPAVVAATTQMQTRITASTAGSIWRSDGRRSVQRAPPEIQIRNTGPSVRLGNALARYQCDQKIQ